MPIIKSWRYLFTLSNVINNLYLLLYSIGSMLYNNKKGVPSAESSRCVRGLGKCQWQALPSPVQCEETATRTRGLPVTYNNHLAYSISNLYLISSELVFYMFNKLIFVLKFRVMDLVKLVIDCLPHTKRGHFIQNYITNTKHLCMWEVQLHSTLFYIF